MNAAIYCRVSSDKQEDNYSLSSQETACRRYANQHGHNVVQVFQEIYTGTALWERPQLTALRERIRAGEIEVIIVYAVDRLSRNQAHLFILVDEWERHGAAPAFVTEELDQSPIGKMLLSLKGFAAEVEREKIQERTQRGLDSRLKAGKLKPGRCALYGYRWPVEAREGAGGVVPTIVRDRYEIDPDTAPIVQRIFQWYVEGVPLLGITQQLNDNGVLNPTGTGLWRRAVVQKLIKNPAYKGEAWMNRYQIVSERGRRKMIARPVEEWERLPDGVIPPLVDEAVWVAAQERATRNAIDAARRNADPEAFLLRAGFVVCGHCGRPAGATKKKDRDGRVIPTYLIHSSPEQHLDCPITTITAAELDNAAVIYLKRVALNAEVLEWEIGRLSGSAVAIEADLGAVASRLTAVTRKQRMLGTAIEALNDPEAAEPLLDRLRALAVEKRSLEEEQRGVIARTADQTATLARIRDLRDHAGELAEHFDQLPYQTKRDMLAAINLTVKLYPASAPDRYTFESDVDGLMLAIGFPSHAR